MTGWQDISTAPRDGSRIVCWAPGWEDGPIFLRWKTNPRITYDIAAGHKDCVDTYFGDPEEYDDYYYALPGGGPTHWHPLEPLPVVIATRKAAGEERPK